MTIPDITLTQIFDFVGTVAFAISGIRLASAKKFDLFGSDPRALYMLDNELAARVYSAPSLVL